MRKGLAVSAVLIGLVVAGCSGNSGEGGDQGGSVAPQPAQGEPKSSRTAPAKAVDIAEKCSIVTPPQWQGIGADQAPRERDSNGRLGCQYQKGQAGTPGWGVFVAANGQTTFNEEVGKRQQPTKTAEMAGYPMVEYQTETGCVLYVDISDRGFLISNVIKTSSADPGVDLCQTGEKFAEAAVQNLPNA